MLLTNTGKQLREGALWKALKRRAARAGVRVREQEPDKRGKTPDNPSEVTPHMLRRTFATTLRRRGSSLDVVASILGHASLDTTRRHYASHSDEQRKQAMDSFQLD